ncbi:MAG: hypothetical protein QF662_06570, partial [Phycisphaerae bacterium]|nr:hypothetical protein [Phycisphaerae bacterium]
MTSKRCVILVACVLGALCSRAAGVRTAAFAEVNEKAFQKGEMEGTVWTSLGKMRLARDLATLVDEKADISYIAALAEARDGTIYAATSVKGEIYRIKKDKAEVLATLH